MKIDFYKFIWILIHFLCSIQDYCVKLISSIHRNLLEFINQNRQDNLLNDKYLIECNKIYLKKTPVHLVIILGTESPHFEALSKIIFWGLSAGIQHISFYDHKGQLFYNNFVSNLFSNELFYAISGVLVAENYKIYEYLSKWKRDNDRIFWNVNTNGVCGSQIVYKNGLKKELSVNFLSPEDCKMKISELCRELAADTDIAVDKINIDYLNGKFSQIIHPDPDLAIYFGDICCTFGLLPWHIRLTEFINVKTQHALTIHKFLETLFKYAKCEQRFGF